MIKHNGHLRTQGKCRKHEPQASSFVLLYRSYVLKTIKHGFSMFYTLINYGFFDESEHMQGPSYIVIESKST